MEIILSGIIIFMILGAIYAIHARDLLSALISCGIVGYGLVICFLLLKAPDLAIVQIVVETITLIIMVSIVLASTRFELDKEPGIQHKSRLNRQLLGHTLIAVIIGIVLLYSFRLAITHLDSFGDHTLRMSEAYLEGAAEKTGSANLVTGILFDFRGYDTFGVATILFTAVIGILTILRIKGRK
ncbi:Na(+)/H(+) antiporter subunit A [subsurface metagenome]